MTKQKVFIIEESRYFKLGEEVEGFPVDGGVRVGEHFLSEEQAVVLSEALTKTDEEKIRRMIREMLKTMFWRMYTRSAFIVK
jgi:hypothetical protein